MKKHTTHGRNILMSNNGLRAEPWTWPIHTMNASTVQGYPRGLVESQTYSITTLQAITGHLRCDHHRPRIRQRRTNMDAFRARARGAKTHWDPMPVIRFVEAIGIYLPVPRWS